MTLYGFIFYMDAAVILAATGLAITRPNPVHAVIYLIISFLGSAVLFYLLGAPFLAALEVIIYAGAVMVLFLFVIMMLRPLMMPSNEKAEAGGSIFRQWGPGILLGLLFFLIAALIFIKDPASRVTLEMMMAMPGQFGRFVFTRYWLSIEIISLLLLLGLLAAIQLGKGKGNPEHYNEREEDSR